jgi:4-alpha-glucanotransferase
MTDNYNIIDNIMVLPSNHDSNTICTWYNKMNDDNKNRLKEFLRNNDCTDNDINIGLIEYCFKSKSKIVMVTVQDIIGLDDNARINVPGTDNFKNWTWKLEDFSEFKNKIHIFKNIDNI